MHILLADDNPHDVFFVQHALKQIAQPVELSVVQDGQQALDFLLRAAPYAHVTRPDIVLLDINMPRKTGIEVLTARGHDPQLQCMPVIMFTSSTLQHEITRCYEWGANAYLEKPAGLAKLYDILKAVIEFWGRASIVCWRTGISPPPWVYRWCRPHPHTAPAGHTGEQRGDEMSRGTPRLSPFVARSRENMEQ